MLRVSQIVLVAFLLLSKQGTAYSVETHELLIDLSWKASIAPFLLNNFPHTTPQELEVAHAYAYGGSAIQDLGYYPFGKQLFSNLTHYVRSADFVQYLFEQAKNVNELAFAVGALSHYVGDSIGHLEAINRSVPVEFPKLGKEYGPAVTYEQNPHAHVRTEFAFDVNEVSKRRMAPSAYLRHVGLRVPSALLARAFAETYGLNFSTTIGRPHAVVRLYRFGVRNFIPRIAYAENVIHKHSFPPDDQTEAFQTYLHSLASTEFQKTWDQFRKKAGIGTHLLAFVIFISPKVGPLALFGVRGPSSTTHQQYVESLNAATSQLQSLLSRAHPRPPSIPNRDLDTGQTVSPGKYRLTDRTYATLLGRITNQPSAAIPPGVKADILKYYSDPNAPISTKKNRSAWADVQHELIVLQGMKTYRETILPEVPDNGGGQ